MAEQSGASSSSDSGNSEMMLPPTTMMTSSSSGKSARTTHHHREDVVGTNSEHYFKPVLDYSPYFEQQHDVNIEGRGIFRVYTINHDHRTSSSHSESGYHNSSTQPTNSIFGKVDKSETVIAFIHGAGLTSLSWAICIKQLQQYVVKSGGNAQNINMLRSSLLE